MYTSMCVFVCVQTIKKTAQHEQTPSDVDVGVSVAVA